MLAAGIVGVGWWGQNLVNASGAAENIEFVAGAVRNPDKVAEFADEKGMTLHTGLEAMLEEADLDAVVLATPHTLHVEQMLTAIEAGKHVLSEKPFTLTKADAERVLDAADAAGVTAVVGHNRRFVPSMAELRDKHTELQKQLERDVEAIGHDTSLFFRLVLVCIETKFCIQIRIFQHFSKSTELSS